MLWLKFKAQWLFYRVATAKVALGALKFGAGALKGDRGLQEAGAKKNLTGAAVGVAAHALPSNNGGTANTFNQQLGGLFGRK